MQNPSLRRQKEQILCHILIDPTKQWLILYDYNFRGDVYLKGKDNYYHRSIQEQNPMSCLGSDEFSNGHIKISDFNTRKWGVGDGITPSRPVSASMFLFYGYNYEEDWPSMHNDAVMMQDFAKKYNIDVKRVTTNDHAKVTNESVVKSQAQFRKWFQEFLSQTQYKDLIVGVSTHGTPYKYQNYDMDMYGEAIFFGTDQQGNDIYYPDKYLMQDINDYLTPNVFLHLVIDTCFSGGIVNLWEFKNRLSKNVILYSAANSEIEAFGNGQSGGYLTGYWVKFAKPGRFAFQIADDILQSIEYLDQAKFAEVISPQVKYSRPALSLWPPSSLRPDSFSSKQINVAL